MHPTSEWREESQTHLRYINPGQWLKQSSPSEDMEPFIQAPYINPSVLTSLPVSILRSEGQRRAQEVKFSEELNFDGRSLEPTYNIAQSDKAMLRALRRGMGSTTLRMRHVGDKIVINFIEALKVILVTVTMSASDILLGISLIDIDWYILL